MNFFCNTLALALAKFFPGENFPLYGTLSMVYIMTNNACNYNILNYNIHGYGFLYSLKGISGYSTYSVDRIIYQTKPNSTHTQTNRHARTHTHMLIHFYHCTLYHHYRKRRYAQELSVLENPAYTHTHTPLAKTSSVDPLVNDDDALDYDELSPQAPVRPPKPSPQPRSALLVGL